MGFFDFLFGKNQGTQNTNTSGVLQNNPTNTFSSSNNKSKSSVGSLDLSKENMLNLSKEESLKQLNLKKEKIQLLCLEKAPLNNLTARVAVVMDFSGSMRTLYENGTVQAILDRLLPVAMQFDDNGEMEVWLFDDGFKRMDDISLDNYYGYIENNKVLKRHMGGTRYEPVIKDVVKTYTKKSKSKLPALVLFITDGDNFSEDKKPATKAIVDASTKPIFWQFIGIGNSNFKFLKTLDDMEGRYIDNANFFSVNDLMRVSDDELYRRLLNEYPSWITEAREKGLID